MNEISLMVSLVVFAALAVGSFLLLRGREPRQQLEILSNAHYAYTLVIALVALGYAVTQLYGAYLWLPDPRASVGLLRSVDGDRNLKSESSHGIGTSRGCSRSLVGLALESGKVRWSTYTPPTSNAGTGTS